MKILFIRPYYGININGDMGGDIGTVDYSPQISPDLSFLYSASLAIEHGLDVVAIDCNAEKMQVRELLKKMQGMDFEYIMVKAAAPSINLDLLFCKKIRQIFKDAKIVICGHVSAIIKEYIVDNVHEINDVADNSMEDYVFNKILNKAEKLTMDDLPSPNYELFNYKIYNDGNKKIGYLWSSKGCNLKCSYCPYYAYYGDKIDYRSISKVMEDIYHLVSLGINYVQFRDPFFSSNRKRVIELCNCIIENDLDFKWFCETRIDTLDEKLIDIMCKAGCRSVAFGVESADSTILKKYSRPIYDYQKAIDNVKLLKKRNINSLAFYMVGFPEDTYESITETYRLAEKIDSDYAQFNVFTVYPDTKLFAEKVEPEFFIEGENMTKKNICHNISRSELESIVKEFKFLYSMRKYGLEYAVKESEYSFSLKERGKKIFNRHVSILREEVLL